jgi:hypothetical protein
MIPAKEERDALVAALAELIAEHGHSDFLGSPILTASAAHFPDPWRADEDGAAAMLRRLLWWQRLGDVPFTMEEFDAERTVEVRDDHGSTFVRPLHGVAAWFAGRDGKTLRFGVNVRVLTAPEALAGVLAHEVAHAWRLLKDEWVTDRGHEEQLTDVTTVFLNCGVLTCNNAERFHSSGELVGGRSYHRYGVESYGYLSPPALAFLLAVQLHARGDSKEIDRVEAALERNQRSSLREGLALLEKEPPNLGLPSPGQRLPPSPRVELPRLELPPPEAPPPPEPAPEVIGFRLGERRLPKALAWAAGGFLLALFLSFWAREWAFVLPVVTGLVAFFRRRRRCSRCDTKVGEQAEECSSCHARLVGDIESLRDMHDAEDDWRRRQVEVRHRETLQDQAVLEQEAVESQPED